MATLICGTIFHMVDDPRKSEGALQVIEEGAILVSGDGKIERLGTKRELLKSSSLAQVHDYGDAFLLPTFIDTHSHFPQLDIVGRPSGNLLEWLSQTTFPAETLFAEEKVAADAADFFTDSLLRNGIGGACLFSSSHLKAADILAETCHKKGLRVVLGRSSMDQGAPEALLTSIEEDTKRNLFLIEKWHKKHKRMHIALTPRFAPSCSEGMMEAMREVLREHKGLYVQTHHSENLDEIKLVERLFPNDKNYLSVYERFGLLGERTLLAHVIHANSEEKELLVERGSIISHCPTSNFFLGSGLFPYKDFYEKNAAITLGTDIGAGTSFSMWQTINEAYKVSQLNGFAVPLEWWFYHATLGAAKSLSWQADCGSLEAGKDADIQVIDPKRGRLFERRFLQGFSSPKNILEALVFLSDDRHVSHVYLQGERKSFGPTPVPT